MSHSLSRKQAIILGLVVLLSLTLTTGGLFAVASRQWVWGDTLRLSVGFAEIRGVETGTRVRVQGIDAGDVEAIELPSIPGESVRLRLRLDGRLRQLVRADATARIVSEGLIGGKVIEIQPGSPTAEPVQENAALASQSTPELGDLLIQVNQTLQGIRQGEGTVGKLVTDAEAYAGLVAVLQQSKDAMTSVQQDADAIKRLPIVRNYVEDKYELLVRPNCDQYRQCLAETELFEPGRAILTEAGRHRLDGIAPWLNGMKYKGSEVVVAACADPSRSNPAVAQTVTRQQSEAVCNYLKNRHSVQKMGWFSSRKVTAVGCGVNPPPLPETEKLAPARVEILVFIPQA